MNSKQKQLITGRHQYFKDEVNPQDLIPYLKCLIPEDVQEVECVLNNQGPIRALSALLDRLKRRRQGFEQFVEALRKTSLDHVAQLLDPMEEVVVEDDAEIDDSKFKVIGTALDVKIIARIIDTSQGDERKTEYEKMIAKEFESSSNEKSKKVRKVFIKDMPRGIVFVRTKQMGHALNFSPERQEEDKEKENDKTDEVKQDQDRYEKKDKEKDENIANDTKKEKLENEKHESENGDGDVDVDVDEEKDVDEAENHESKEKEDDGENVADKAEETTQDKDESENVDEELESDKEASHTLNSSNSSEENSEKETNGGDSISAIFRLTSIEHAKSFWEIYKSSDLEKAILKNLVLNTLIEKNIIREQDDFLKLKLMFLEEDYEKIIDFFENVESEQSLEMAGNDLLLSEDSNHLSGLDEGVIRIPQVCLESQRENIYKRNLKLRGYQSELAGPALEGKNCIICAPTNSGKTFVAMEIAKLHLEKYKVDDRLAMSGKTDAPKVIFIVSTQNLVLQQRTRFEEYLTKYSISDISGSNSTEIPLDFLLKTHDVVILTAQILLNALEKNNVKISQITLLIFDECHHTNKDHAYNKIMQRYMAIKYLAAMDSCKLPQILGLTASLGVGKSSESEKAKNHILKICANMDAKCISTVRENIEELEKNVTGGVPRRKMENVDQVSNVFEKVISQVMGKIEKAAENHYISANGVPADRVGQQYRQWVEGVYKDAVGKGHRDLVTYAQQLRRYHVSLIINDTVRIKDAMKYLDEFFDNLDESKFLNTDKKLLNLFKQARTFIHSRKDNEPLNPKLNKLKELILNFHEEDKAKGKKGETKGILFTRTRDSTVGLLGWIDDTKELKDILRPKTLVGAGDGEVGMTQGEQEAIIEEFKKGEVNILIATTVAEEGLNIGDCNFVIRYNMAGNEISSVQSRGRIRADEGNYVYLGDTRTRGVNREVVNQYREMLMVAAVEEVQQIPYADYIKKIESIQKKNVQDNNLKSILSARKKKAGLKSDDATFFCRRCNNMACQLNHFRRLKDSFHVVLDKSFVDERVQLKQRKKPKKVDDILMETKVHCKNCGEDWGTTVKIDGFTWPCLKISSFAVEFTGNKRSMYKKWSEFPLVIPEAQLSEILEMDDSLDLELEDSAFDL